MIPALPFIITLCATVGYIAGIAYTMWTTERGINRADISEANKRMIRDVLGISTPGEK